MPLLGLLLFLPGDRHVDQQERLAGEIGRLQDADLAVAALEFEKVVVRLRCIRRVRDGYRDQLREIVVPQLRFARGGCLPELGQRLATSGQG